MPRKLDRKWRRVFLAALGRCGNVRVAAREAGVDPGTAYDLRIKDEAFAAKLETARAAGIAKAAKTKARRAKGGAALVLRRTRRGDQLIRAGEGRWSQEAERLFLEALRRTGCVRRAADACGFSTTALYGRRGRYEEFAEAWRGAEREAAERVPSLLAAAAIAALDPDMAAGSRSGSRLPKIDVNQAIAISRLKGGGAGGGSRGTAGRGGIRPRIATNAEVRAELQKALVAFERREKAARRGQGWQRTAAGGLVPPGWSWTGTAAGDADPNRPAPSEEEE